MHFKKNLHNEAVNNLIELGSKNGYITYNDINGILPAFLLTSEQLPKVLDILKTKSIEYLNAPKKEIKFQKYKKKSHNLAIFKLIEIAQNNGFITSTQINEILPNFLLNPNHLNPILEILNNNNIKIISNSIDDDALVIIDVEIVSGPSLNPKGVKWKGDMQIINTNHGKFIDTLPGDQYGNELPGYDWSDHIDGEPVKIFNKSNSVADYPWLKKESIKGRIPKQKIFESNEKNIIQIKKLISKDESATCEFKRSAVWGPGNTNDIKITNGKKQILKAIAGFSNAKKGGILLIGVHDNKQIIGLEDDFKFRGNKDKWIQVLVMNFKVAFGDHFSPTWLNQYFVDDNDKEVYVIEVSPNIEPIFLDEDFYVRDGNVTKPLKGKEQSSFIQQRFY